MVCPEAININVYNKVAQAERPLGHKAIVPQAEMLLKFELDSQSIYI